MRSTTIEEMKELTAEILSKRGYIIENGTLRKAGLGDANGLAVVSAIVDMAGGGTCTIGDLTAGQFLDKDIRGTRYGCEAMLWLMAVAGVSHSSEIGGQYVRVAFDKDGRATCIGHSVKDTWLDFKMLAEGINCIPMQNAAEKAIVLTRDNFSRYGEAALQAGIKMYEYCEIHPEMDNNAHLKERRDIIWKTIVDLFNDPNFNPDDPEQQRKDEYNRTHFGG